MRTLALALVLVARPPPLAILRPHVAPLASTHAVAVTVTVTVNKPGAVPYLLTTSRYPASGYFFFFLAATTRSSLCPTCDLPSVSDPCFSARGLLRLLQLRRAFATSTLVSCTTAEHPARICTFIAVPHHISTTIPRCAYRPSLVSRFSPQATPYAHRGPRFSGTRRRRRHILQADTDPDPDIDSSHRSIRLRSQSPGLKRAFLVRAALHCTAPRQPRFLSRSLRHPPNLS